MILSEQWAIPCLAAFCLGLHHGDKAFSKLLEAEMSAGPVVGRSKVLLK